MVDALKKLQAETALIEVATNQSKGVTYGDQQKALASFVCLRN